MAITRLKRKTLRKKVQARQKKSVLKYLTQKPILKNSDRTVTSEPA